MTGDERQQIGRIAGYLGIHPDDFRRLEAVHRPSAPNPYDVLGLSAQATDAEIKKTYRSLVKKYHPDALHGLGESAVKEAEATFRKIQEAYDQICSQRGIK
jgi:DnaJ like chaperone protein